MMRTSKEIEGIVLNNADINALKSALYTLYCDQNTHGDVEADKESIRAFQVVKKIAEKLGVKIKD